MDDDITRLFGLSFCMLVGCYVAGAIPLAFTMSEVGYVIVSKGYMYLAL